MPPKKKSSIGRKNRKKPQEAGGLSIQASTPLSSLPPPRSLKRKARETPAQLVSPPSKTRRRGTRTTAASLPPKLLSVTKDVVSLFIELDELDEKLLKKAVSMIREKLEGAVEATVEVEVIDVESPNTMSNARIQTETTQEGTPVIESSDSPTAAPTHTQEAGATETAAPSPIKPRQKAPFPSLIPLNERAFKPPTILLRGNRRIVQQKEKQSQGLSQI